MSDVEIRATVRDDVGALAELAATLEAVDGATNNAVAAAATATTKAGEASASATAAANAANGVAEEIVTEVADMLEPPSSFFTFQKKIAVTGTAVQLSATSRPITRGVIIQANPGNSGPIVIGPVGVTNVTDGTGNGKVLQPGQSWAFDVSDLNLLYVNGAAGDWVDGSLS